MKRGVAAESAGAEDTDRASGGSNTMSATDSQNGTESDDVTIDGRTYEQVPESWIEHGVDFDIGHPRMVAVSVAILDEADLLRVRYVDPRTLDVLETTTGAIETDDGIIPAALPSQTAEWPRSLVPAEGVEPTGELRAREVEWLDELWGDRLDGVEVGA
ncbi:MAG: hypothetical protein ACOCY1_04925 [Halovenus sp.]